MVGWKSYLVTFLMCLAVSAGAIYLYDRYYATKIVSIDIRKYVADQRSLFLDGKLTEKDLNSNLDRLRQLIDGVPSNSVVIASDVVIKNAETIAP